MMLNSFLLAALLLAPAPGIRPGGVPAAQNVYPAWNAGTAYKAGDLVSYVGVAYVCLRAHTSRAGQEPPAASELWRVFCGPETPAPPVPQGLAAVPDGPGRVLVTWAPAPGAAGYDLQVDGTLRNGAASPFRHRGLAPGSAHVYRVRAVNDGGTSAWSEPVTCSAERATSGR